MGAGKRHNKRYKNFDATVLNLPSSLESPLFYNAFRHALTQGRLQSPEVTTMALDGLRVRVRDGNANRVRFPTPITQELSVHLQTTTWDIQVHRHAWNYRPHPALVGRMCEGSWKKCFDPGRGSCSGAPSPLSQIFSRLALHIDKKKEGYNRK